MSLYDVLGVPRSATAKEIRTAYRQQALLSHPDKHPGDDSARRRFLEVSEAYAVLGDEHRRARYDRGATIDDAPPDVDLRRANDLFNANFGQALMRQWSPGLTVVGTLVSNGRRKVFTIYPDGSTEEQEETAASSVFNYLRTTTTLPGGGSWHTIQLTTSLGARLASLLVPRSLAERPLFGRLATAAVSWLPTALAATLAVRLLRGPSRQPGSLPDSLAVSLSSAATAGIRFDGLVPPV
mmetsp:Transcript_26973/g.89769  ORF Transcript_26973/g.89769 Transcript_26973/m.89769 type:complete len:239 (-) Transcript_26973:201-917(-)